MADFEIGDKIRASRTGTVTSVTSNWVSIDAASEFPRNKVWDFEVIEKRKRKVGDEMTEALFASLPPGSLVQYFATHHIYVATRGQWMSVRTGETYSPEKFSPSAYTIKYIPE